MWTHRELFFFNIESRSESQNAYDELVRLHLHSFYVLFINLCLFWFPSGIFYVPILKLTAPADECLIRNVDDAFVKLLIKEIKARPILCPDPLLCLVSGINNSDEFKEENIKDYTYQTIGGNHRRSAYQALLAEKHIDDTSLIPVRLVFGMFY